jgi:MFS family permease
VVFILRTRPDRSFVASRDRLERPVERLASRAGVGKGASRGLPMNQKVTEASVSPAVGRRVVALAGAVALAVAMGIGRFAFTPLLPMMLDDGVIDLQAASWLASANYLGYLVGALLCTFQPWIWARARILPAVDAPTLVRAGLAATVLLTLAMALPIPALWPSLRFAAGVASAVVFVFTSGWCLAQLARQGASALGGAMYTGPGAGTVVSGFLAGAMVSWDWRAASGWLIFGILAALLTAAVWRVFGRGTFPRPGSGPERATGAGGAVAAPGRIEIAAMAVAYRLAGFGYIVTATFLPVIARQALPGSAWLDLFWPIFGSGVIAGALLATRLRLDGDLRLLLAACYVVQAIGIGVGVWRPTPAGFALGSLLLGLPFTAITFFAMHEARRLRPSAVASTMGLLTALYGIGQIVGPPMAAALLDRSADAREGFALSLQIAAGALLAGALTYLWMAWSFPPAGGRPPGGPRPTR